MTEQQYGRMFRWLTIAARVIVGCVFIMSGCAKMIDPWGFTFKIEDYLGVWHWSVPQALVVTGGSLLSLVEFTAGVAMLFGCYRRMALYAVSAIMAVMLPLTAYIAIADPVPDCGCFGDWIVVSNSMTLAKNIVITAIIVWLWRWNNRVDSAIPAPVQWVSTTLSILYMVIIGVTGYNIQPMIDFRPYPIGLSLTDTARDDDTPALRFVYEKDGRQQEFTADNLPDSSWTFVERIGETDDNDSEIAIYDEDEEQVALEDIVTDDGMQLIILIPDIEATDPSMTFTINELNAAISKAGGSAIAIIAANGDEAIQDWRDFSLADYPIYTADPIDIKIMARGTVALVMVNDGVIVWKRTLNSIDPDLTGHRDIRDVMLNRLIPPGAKMFWWMTAIFALMQLSLTLPIVVRFITRTLKK